MNHHLNNARRIAKLLDSQFSFLGIKFGIEPIIGVIPGVGDVVALILSLYTVFVGIQMKLPSSKLAQMVFNVLADFLIGLVPIVGDVADVFYRANLKNLDILEKFAKVEEARLPARQGKIIR